MRCVSTLGFRSSTLVSCFLLGAIFTGCDKFIEGTLNAQRGFQINTIDSKTVSVPAGVYYSILDIDEDGSRPIRLIVTLEEKSYLLDPSWKPQTFVIPLPGSYDIREKGETFTATGEQIGQNFDVLGQIKEVDETLPQEIVQKCKWARFYDVTVHKERKGVHLNLQLTDSSEVLGLLDFDINVLETEVVDREILTGYMVHFPLRGVVIPISYYHDLRVRKDR